jgi:hypothetical protein
MNLEVIKLREAVQAQKTNTTFNVESEQGEPVQTVNGRDATRGGGEIGKIWERLKEYRFSIIE